MSESPYFDRPEARHDPAPGAEQLTVAEIHARLRAEAERAGRRYPVAPKAKAAAVWALLGSLGVGLATQIAQNPALIGPLLPEWAVVLVVSLAGSVSGLCGAYRAPHQPRPGDWARGGARRGG